MSRFVQVSRLGCTLKEYATAKKLDEAFLKSLFIVERTYRGHTKLVIPYFDDKGERVCNRFRVGMGVKAGEKKFAWEKGSHPSLYGLWRLKSYSAARVVLVEGESDCHTLWFHGIPALGIAGASMWKEDKDAHHLEKFGLIYAVLEPDQGGEAVLKSLSRSTIRQKVKLVFLPLKDVSALYLDDPDRFEEKFNQALSQAVFLAKYEQERLEAHGSEAWQKCQDLA